jgi:hypothetical protein
MSDIDAVKKNVESTISMLQEEVKKLNSKISHLNIIEISNAELSRQNIYLENEIKILKSDFIELKNFAGSISDQLDENIYTIKDILDS